MVRTRAQRGKGLVTPSPKISSQIADECNPNDDGTTPKSMRGTRGEKKFMLTKNKELSIETPKGKPANGKTRTRRRSASVSEETKEKVAREDEITDERLVEQSPLKTSGRKKKKERRTAIIEDSSSESVRIDSEGEIHYEDEDGIEEMANVVRKRDKRTMQIDDEDEEQEEDDEEEENKGGEDEDEEEDEDTEKTRKISSHSEAERLGDGAPDEDDEDSDAPEDVSFSRSRQEALDSISQALQHSRRSEEVAKAKRRKRDKLLKLQKEKKKISLQHSRLPDDFLAEIVDLPSQKDVKLAPEMTSQSQPKKSGQHKMFDSDEEDAMSGDDFIPFAPDEPCMVKGFEVHAISRQQRAPPPKSESALDFLQKQLYGSKIKRESVNKHRSRMLKRHGRPAMVFVNPKEKKRKLQD